ncbi:IS1096 element passenger TnpR family protein [Burkholderia cenocepacia]|uniref:IS1096 element passenger TnpR family protein n=1 Tax=Burkholderia cenocepacia TaxID=95486 RepID=UPI002A369835|nr:phage integrase family protein [Burkholderia cenocepacia]
MANRPQAVAVPPPATYTRTDFAALRARIQGIPAAAIARRFYDVEDSAVPAEADAVERHLATMRDALVRLALLNGSAALADHLRASMRQHGEAKLTALTLRMVEDAAKLAAAAPAADHALALWFRPLVAQRLVGEGIATLGALIAYCNRHGGSWWRSIPRIGPLRAKTLVAWLRRHEATLGARVDADVDATPLTPAPDRAIVVGPGTDGLAPLERLAAPVELSGAGGTNRAVGFPFIRAEHDLAALHAWLMRYRDRPATLRAYTREIERFVLWALKVRGVAVSSLRVEDCDAYKDFLAQPSADFCGPKRPRASGRWRPFTGSLSADSQAYAVRMLRMAFDWLVKVRYLAGNPFSAVTLPATLTREWSLQVERALAPDLLRTLRETLDAHCARADDDAVQWRIARAAIGLMVDSGLRRAEAASARHSGLKRVDGIKGQSVWTLTLVGKRSKVRTVPVSPATLEALRAHWADRGLAWEGRGVSEARDATANDPPLIAPLAIPGTAAAQARHGEGLVAEGGPDVGSYTPDALGRLVRTALSRLQGELQRWGALSLWDAAQLQRASAHALRHTFGTDATARGVPIDVVQQILGHASLATTSIYVKAQQQRVLEAALDYYQQQAQAVPAESAGAFAPQWIRDDEQGDAFSARNDDEVAGMRTAPIKLTLRVENVAPTGRGRARTIRALERGILADHAAERLAPGVYALKVLHEGDAALDVALDDLFDEIRDEAHLHHCVAEIDAQWVGTARTWTYRVPAGNVIPFPGGAGSSASAAGNGVEAPPGPRVMRLRVSLQGVMPEIWRRLEVPADMSLDELHDVIQAAMGWHDRHRYGFGFAGPVGALNPLASGAADVRLEEVAAISAALTYTYDLDDDWRHAVTIEAVGPVAAGTRYPRCVAGAGACPPEDCGGPAGYAQLVRTLAGRMTDAKRELLAWLGEPFDPDGFRLPEANARLAVL